MIREVAILFKNGSKVSFEAQEFDVDLSRQGVGAAGYNTVQKFTYKDSQGTDTPVYLTPNEVAGIVVAYSDSAHTRSLKVH